MRIGIDLGGTKIEIIALDDSGHTLLRQRTETPQGDYQATVSAIVQLVKKTEEKLDRKGTVGIGIPGSPSPTTGLIRNANSTCLNGMPLQQDVETALGREVRIANDANCFALSEAVDGAGAGFHSVFGVIIGTGTGGGIVINGQVQQGVNLVGGEWGHNPMPWLNKEDYPGLSCWCGKQGCIETFLSGSGLSRHYLARYNQQLNAQQIAEAAESGNPDANAMLEQYEEWLAQALASVINVIDPDVIVLGGGLSNLQRLYENVPGKLQHYVFSDQVTTRILPPQHGDSSGVRGAAWLE